MAKKKTKKKKKGFTLIELLIVIAIIGILAAVVLASISSARTKAAQAAFKAAASSLPPSLVMKCDAANGTGQVNVNTTEVPALAAGFNYSCATQSSVTINVSDARAVNCNGSNVNEAGPRFVANCT